MTVRATILAARVTGKGEASAYIPVVSFQTLLDRMSQTLSHRRCTLRRAMCHACAVAIGVAAVAMTSRAQGRRVIRFDSVEVHTRAGDSLSVELGSLQVPEDYRSPGGRQVTLRFYRFRTTGLEGGAPIIYLAGGPGSSGTAVVRGGRFEVILALREVGDLILLDQRGTGLAVPNLECPQPFRYPTDRRADLRRMLLAYQRFAVSCARYWRRQGVDLAAYTTEASADDLAALTDALGVPQIRLVGGSYGTHLALSMIRRHPQMVQRAALFGIEGPDHTLKLPAQIDEHLTMVSAQFTALRCCATASEFRKRLSELAWRLDRSPATVTIQPTSSGEERKTVVVSGFDVRAATAALVGRRSGIEQLAQIASAAFADNLAPLAEVVREERMTPISAMGAVMDCASGASPERTHVVDIQAPRTLLGTLVDFPFPDWCRAWGVRPLPDEFRAPIRSDVRVLMVAGTLDGLTPISNAAEVRRGLSRGTLVTVNNAGHDSLADSPATRKILHEFLATGSARDTTIDMPPLNLEKDSP